MEMNLKIDPEFQGKIPPLTDAEFEQLKENILTAGEVYEPIVVWNGTIVDGHNRYRIVMEHPEIKWRTREMSFEDKWEAFDWMYKNQLGRRNLTEEQRKYLLGKQYEARMHTHGGDRGNQHTKVPSAHCGHLPENRVREQIAKEQNVGKTTVERAKNYARGIDAIREQEPEFAESILQSKVKTNQVDIQAIGMAPTEKQKGMIDSIKAGKRITTRRELDSSKEEKERLEQIENVAQSLFDTNNVVEYSIVNLLRDIQNNSAPFVRLMNQLITHNKKLCGKNKEAVIKAIRENITDKINEIEKEINSYE